MDLLYIKVLLKMLYACVMGGIPQVFHILVNHAMNCSTGGTLLSGIMNLEILLLLFFQKYVMTSVLSPTLTILLNVSRQVVQDSTFSFTNDQEPTEAPR